MIHTRPLPLDKEKLLALSDTLNRSNLDEFSGQVRAYPDAHG